MANDRANKRQKGGHDFFQSQSDYQLPTPLSMSRGKTFLEGVQKLAKGGNESVFTQLDLPFTNRTYETKGKKNPVTTATDSPGKVGLVASIGVMRPGEKKEFAQGVLMPMGKTSYFDDQRKGKAVPSTLTMNTAKMESRAMKYLSMDGAQYTPKTDIVADELKPETEALVNKKRANEEVHWGGLAVGSFLEEITGSRGLGLHGVGSGMRAMTMAAKWTMKSGAETKDDGFGARMLKAFPQLGKKKMGTGFGASALYQDLKSGGAKRDKVLEHHVGLGGSIYKAHLEARNAAKQRFEDKLGLLQSGSSADGQGKWWQEKAKTTNFQTLDSQGVKNLRREYLQTKLERHAIALAPKPHDFAKQEAKRQLQTLGVDKAKDPVTYKQQKHALVMNAMTKASFDTTKVQQQREVKDKFAAKLTALSEGRTVKGSFWQTKGNTGTDFKSLNTDQRNTLKQEYLAHQKSKR